MLGIAELVTVPFLLAILAQWVRAERVRTAVLDRRLAGEPALPGTSSGLVRPWWETEVSEVAARARRQGRGD
ncbi:hypothetical protein GCM10010313_49790 [Streptomyces violarus]|uniref:Uncharacterized protein n=2 Tax=Streptomyces TaxID=1883 RepID=A0A7W4ZSR2_9ACTN|nr:hypothetical protein [Streptomyces violarus]GHD19080.1 hypothetical protein GCM10010313_49790 [Streptomyces violarus]